MGTETDLFNYSKPEEDNQQEFIVCLPGSEQTLKSYIDLKTLLYQFEFEDMPPAVWTFPNVSASDRVINILRKQLNYGKNPVCIFIDITFCLKNDIFENQNRFQPLLELFRNQKDKVFNIIVCTDEI